MLKKLLLGVAVPPHPPNTQLPGSSPVLDTLQGHWPA